MIQLENYKRELAFVFFVKKKKIVLTILLMTVIAVAVSFLSPPIYTAEGSLLVKSKKITRDLETLEKTQLRTEAVEEQDLYSEMAILLSGEVMRKAVESLEEDEASSELMELLGSEVDYRYLALQRLFDARVVPDSNVLAVRLQADSPVNAQNLLEAIMEQYIQYRTELYDPKSMTFYFKKQMDRYREDANQKREEIRVLVEAGGVTQASTQITNNLEIRKDLMNSIMKLQSDAVSAELEVKDLEKWLLNPDQVQFFSFVDNDGILTQSVRFQELYEKQRDIQSRYLEGSEAAIRAQEQVKQAYNALRDEIFRYVEDRKTGLQIIERKIDMLSRQADKIERDNIDLRNNQLEIDQLEKDLDVIRSSYDIFFQRSQESIASDDSQAVNLNSYVAILSPSLAEPDPIFPKPKLLIPLGIITGLILGLTLGFLFEFLDHTFKRPQEVEEMMDIPVVLSIMDSGTGSN